MDSTFSGRPVYVHHPGDPISSDLDVVRGEADGWVVRSFYNEKDGKHWVQFIVVTDAGELAVQRGWKLSNCYEGQKFADGGTWNGMNYNKEITAGEYEHLAIVPDPRYEESIILTPEEFKRYNENKDLELKRLANSKEKRKMGFKMFTRQAVKDVSKLKNALVLLPSSKREVSIEKLILEADQREKDKTSKFVNTKALVKFEGEKMTLGQLMDAHSEALDELDELKSKLKNRKKNEDDFENEDDEDELENEADEDDELENESDEDDEDDDDDDSDKKKQKNKKTKNSRRVNDRRALADEFDDFESGIMQNDSDEDDEDDEADEEEIRTSRRRVNSRDEDEAEADDGDDEDTDELQRRRQRNSRGGRRKLTKKVKNDSKKKSSKDKKKGDKLRNAHNKALEYDRGRVGDGLDPLARGQAMFGNPQAK